MREVLWSAEAIDQFAAAFDYIAERNEPAAENLATQVRETIALMANRPIGRPGYVPETFEKVVQKTSYLLVFELAGDELRILRLFHMSQDWRGWAEDATDLS